MTGIGMELLVPLFVGIAAGLMAAITLRILKDYGLGTLIGIAVIFFIIGVVVARLIFPIPALVEVPNIVGYSEDDAEKIIKEKDLIFNVINRIHSDTVQKYKVISQDFSPGLRVNKNSVINVVVSIGPQTTSTQKPTPTVTYATPIMTVEPATGFRREPDVIFQPANRKITKDTHGSVELYIENPEVNDIVLHVSAKIHTPPDLYLYGSFGGATGATGVVTAKFDIAPGKHATVKALIQPTQTGVYLLDCHATYYPIGHKELASDISTSYVMTVEGIPPTPTVTPPSEPSHAPTPPPTSGIPGFEAMFVIASVFGVFYLLMRQK